MSRSSPEPSADLAIAEADAAELRAAHRSQRTALRRRLAEFRAVPPERYFTELCYCLMTPQSSARQCNLVAEELERRSFYARPFDPEPLLRSHAGGYVRFHRTKARRLLHAREVFPRILPVLRSKQPDKEIRERIIPLVPGLGYKEASHFLRNIGRIDLCILDRHILRNLIRLGALSDWPASISQKRYLAIEALFETVASTLAIPAPELDLLLWSRETGMILK